MSSLRHRLIAFLEERVQLMLRQPRMWGGTEALELQLLQLLEVRSLIAHDQGDAEANFQRLQGLYHRFVAGRAEFRGPALMSEHFLERPEEFVRLFEQFLGTWRHAQPDANPFEDTDIVLRLTLREDVSAPPAAVIGHYYETFRRVVRGIARQNLIGRTPKEIEEATDFLSPDVEIVARNGTRGRVVLPLQVPARAQQELIERESANKVRDALTHLAAMVEWAGSDQPVDAIAGLIPSPERQQRVAFHALRLTPGAASACETLEFGGRVIGRLAPVSLRRTLVPRIQAVMKAGQEPAPFEMQGVVRKLDLDSGSLGLRPADGHAKRVELLLTEDVERPTTLLDTHVRVTGERYRDPLGKLLQFVTQIEVLEPEAPDADDDEDRAE
jgi:hypothetical protein